MKSYEDFKSKTDADLKTIAENRSGIFNDSATSNARIELIGRGLKEIDGFWVVDATTQSILDLQAEIKKLQAGLPKTDLVSSSFWTRATAIFGHLLAIQIILLPVMFIIFYIFR